MRNNLAKRSENAQNPKKNSKQVAPATKNPNDREMIPITMGFDKTVYNATTAYKKAMGMRFEQDVIRVATAKFLRHEGFLK